MNRRISNVMLADDRSQTDSPGRVRAEFNSTTNGPKSRVTVMRDSFEHSNLTNNQLQVWLAQNLVPEAPIYNLAVALHLEGEIDPDHFRRAFRILVDSSDALRTIIEECDGIPMQRILPQAPAMIDFHNVSEDPEVEMRARTLMAARCEAPIDWRRALYDSSLIQIGPKYFIWYLNVHHIVCDGWSFELIYRHMADLYRASVDGRLTDRLDLPAYADYLDYERAFRQSSRHQKSQAFWSEVLAHGSEAVNFYGKQPLRVTTRVRRRSQELGEERTAQLKRMAAVITGKSDSAALFDVFAAAMAGYQYCLNGSDNYTIGMPFHNRRSYRAFKETIGFFSEVLPVRVTLAEDETLASLSKKFGSEVRRAMRYGQHSVTNPIFRRLYDVTLNYHVSAFSDFAGIPARPEWLHNGHGDESLGIQIRNFASTDSLAVDFDLHEAVFDEQDGDRVIAHFMRVLDTFIEDPEMPLQSLRLTSREEAGHLLLRWRGQPVVPSDPRPVHEIFEQRVKEQPDHPSVLSESGSWTYGELNRRANSIAAKLLARGVGRQALVAIYLTRSPELIAAIFGVLKAGAAYIPIDPHYSSEWLKFILEDTGAAVLVTERKLLAEIPENAAEVICLDSPGVIGEPVGENVREVVSDNDLSYVIYTSGSAGTPKGVEITHRALANFAGEAARIFELKPSDRILQFASISFDTSAEEIFPCLISGGTLVLCCGPECMPAATFLEQCRTWQITVLDLPTAYWHELTAGLFAERLTVCDPIRLVIIGGERAIPERLALWQAFVGGRARLLNTYGPTEATVAATVAELTHAPAECGVAVEVSIGRPIANVQTLVLDHNLNPVPEGVPGELYIGGVGLARAYVGRPDLTAEKFIPNPFDIYSGSRLYRTGDIVRHFEDGKLEFLRRSDDQIKVRGFRVELEGIAAVLRQHPLVHDAAVIQEGGRNSGRLVACVVPEGAAALNLKDLQGFVRTRLPEYMVPSVLLSMDSLPLTPRGKLDRRALRRARSQQSGNPEPLVPPQTPVEKRIADLWRELLSLHAIGRDQHFFELGGHSLLAAQAISRIRREWQVEIPLRAIFEAPTVALLAERVERALREGHAPAEATPIPLAIHNGEAPASYSQSRIWYMDQFAPESSAYNITAAIRFTGSLDRQALQQSIDRLVERHESLRTTVRNVDGLPMQVIGSATPTALAALDLTNSPEEGRVEKAKEILREEGRRPFDLSVGPLLRLLLLRLNDDDHVLLLTMHHLISDQWSLNVIAREVSSLYNGFCNGDTPALEPLAAQYGDFAVWQSRRLTPERLRQGLRYWKNQLVGVEASAFPSDRTNSPTQTFRGAYQSFSLPNQLLERLRALALEENATLYMVFLAIFKALLSRYSGRENVAIGSPVTNRTQSEWEGIIGTFINILVLRTDLSGNPSLRQIIQRVRETVLSGFTHQDVPFQKVVEELVPGRDGGRTPFVQVLFNFQSTPVGKVDFEGISWVPFEIDQWAAQFDVSITIDPEITRRAFISYNTDLYDPSTIDRIIGHYVRLLEAAAQNADQSLAAASLLMVEEPTSQTKAGDGLELPIPEKCVHELFEDQARRMPDAIALVYQEQRLTYKELNERSNQLAHRLRALGAGPERLVGIVLERSPELVIGILAVLKSGAAYIPLDPAYPEERIAFICQDSCMAAVLTQKSLVAALPKQNLPILCLDETIASAGTTENLAVPTRSDELAYVIYTSGSTGTPKGVEISHRALTNFLYSMKQTPGLVAEDMLLAVTTISFDIAALELFLPLITGARVMIASRDVAADGERLVAELAASGATAMQATPTTWQMIIEAGWEPKKNFKVICGGEPLPLSLAQGLVSRSNSVWNLYGPTETTVWSALWPIEPGCQRIFIGRPIRNTQIFVLDSKGLPVPVGVPGELYIGGEGLARGYLNRRDLTAEKFVPNPFGASSSRLYRTGDLGRYLADGTIEFIGRIDNQVKVRGFRIELGEVEAVLLRHEDVSQAAVVVSGEETDKRLVAYVVVRDGRSLAEKELLGYAKQKLPNYMVPSAFMFLERLPLTPNGKVDRRALPLPQIGPLDSSEFVAPRTVIEQIIQGIWQEVLNRTQTSIRDNFFDLGGHSLLATQVIARLRDAFRLDLPLRSIFEAPTIAELAAVVDNDLGGPAGERLPPITKAAAEKGNSLSFAQERLWFLNQLQPDHPAYNISLAAEVAGPLDIIALERSVSTVIRRHEILRASFPAIEGRPALAVSAPGPVAISLVDLTATPDAERQDRSLTLILQLVRQPFDLARGPLFRVALLRRGEADHVLVFVVHHIIFDARSAEIFLKEVIEGYDTAVKGEAVEAPEPPLQYADYAAWQRDAQKGEFIERQIEYWKRQLAGVPVLLRLPTDRPRPSTKSYRGACYSWTIAAPTVAALRQLSRRENVTPFMTLLGAFDVLLHRYSGQDDIVIGTPVSNRTAVETEAMIGPSINTLALRTDLSGDPSFRDVLRRVRETALEAYTHQDLPFERLLELLRVERNLAYTPLFQVMFAFQSKLSQGLELQELAIRPLDLDSGTAKFDLTLNLTEVGDEIHAVFEYDTDLFDRDTVERMAGHFKTLLQSVTTNPEQRASELTLLSDAERSQILNHWSVGADSSVELSFLQRSIEK